MNSPTTERPRALATIAREIRRSWKNVYFGAVPYLDALSQLDTIDDAYGLDSAKEIVIRFLGNANSFRGEDARRLKAELKAIAGLK